MSRLTAVLSSTYSSSNSKEFILRDLGQLHKPHDAKLLLTPQGSDPLTCPRSGYSTWTARDSGKRIAQLGLDDPSRSFASLESNISVTGDQDGVVEIWDDRLGDTSVMTFKRYVKSPWRLCIRFKTFSMQV